VGLTTLAGSKGREIKGMSSHATDLAAYAKSSSSFALSILNDASTVENLRWRRNSVFVCVCVPKAL